MRENIRVYSRIYETVYTAVYVRRVPVESLEEVLHGSSSILTRAQGTYLYNLAVASEHGEGICNLLVKYGIQAEPSNCMALVKATERNFTTDIQSLLQAQVCDVNLENSQALLNAIRNRNWEVAEMLIDYGSECCHIFLDRSGQVPQDMCIMVERKKLLLFWQAVKQSGFAQGLPFVVHQKVSSYLARKSVVRTLGLNSVTDEPRKRKRSTVRGILTHLKL
jgi:hypothetical protein